MSKIKKNAENEVVFTKREVSTVVDALIIAYGIMIDKMPLESVQAELKEMRQEVINSFNSFKTQEDEQ